MRGRFAVRLALIGLLAAGALGGCSNNDESTGPQTGVLSVRITDAPAQFDQVNLVVTQVAVFRGSTLPADSDSVSNWTVIRTSSATVDLVTLRNGGSLQLVVGRVPAGTYSMLRLKLGAGSTVVVDGTTYPLTVPSGLQSGLKINGPFTVPADGTLDLVIDVDASRSIIQTGAGTYVLHPVLRVVNSATTGAIVGAVLPDSVETTVFALQAADTVTSTFTASNGHFTLGALPAGTYSVAFHPESAYRDTTLTGVSVTTGHITTLPTLTLTPQ